MLDLDYLKAAKGDPTKAAVLKLRFNRKMEEYKIRCACEKLEGTCTESVEKYLYDSSYPNLQKITEEMEEEEAERNRY